MIGKRFIKNRTYLLIRKRRIKRKRSTISRVAKFKSLINRRLFRSFTRNKAKPKKRKKHLSESYFRRYLFPKKKYLYMRTIALRLNQGLDCQNEELFLLNLNHDLKRQEEFRVLNLKWNHKIIYRPLSMRCFSFGRVYLTHRRRNTFVTINKVFDNSENTPEQVIFKSSCGLLEYLGPKRSTYHARLSVIKTASSFLAEQEFTSIDIIFPSGIARIFRRFIKALCENQIYVRYLISMKRRSHGHTRKKKMRRL